MKTNFPIQSCSFARTLAPALALALAAGLAPTAVGQTSTWNVGSGTTSVGGSWLPVGAPPPANSIVFNYLGDGSIVTFANSHDTFNTCLVHDTQFNGLVRFVAGVGATPRFNGGFRVASSAGDDARMFLDGTFRVTNALSVGSNGGFGSVRVTYNDQLIVEGLAVETNIGINTGSTGVLGVNTPVANLGRAYFQTDGDVCVGRLGATGYLFVDSPGAAENAPLSNRTTANVGRDLYIGRTGGTGNGEVTNGARLLVDGTTRIAEDAGSTGTLVVNSETLGFTSYFDSPVACFVATNGVGGGGGGTGLLQVGFGGQANIGTMLLGDPEGGSGTLRIEGGDVYVNTLHIEATHGHLDFQHGYLYVDSGSFSSVPSLGMALDGPFGGPHLWYRDGATGYQYKNLTIGDAEHGTLVLVGGSQVEYTSTTPGTALCVGKQAGGDGLIYLGDAGTKLTLHGTQGEMVLGAAGSATMTIENGAVLETDGDRSLRMSTTPGSDSLLVVADPGSRVEVDALTMGNGSGVIDKAHLTVANGAEVKTNNLFTRSDSFIYIYNAALSVDRLGFNAPLYTSGGRLVMENGVVNTPTMNIIGGSVVGSGSINGKVSVNSLSAFIEAEGAAGLVLGGDDPSQGFTSSGTLKVGSSSVLLKAPVEATSATTTIAGGVLDSSHGLTINTLLSGFGTVHGDVLNNGAISIAGGQLHIGGHLVSDNKSISGGILDLLSTGTIDASGAIDAGVQTAAGSQFNATGGLTLGGAAIFNGTLDVDGHAMNFTAPGVVRLYGDTALDGGTATAPQAFFIVGEVGTLSGPGTMNGHVSNTGTVSPGKPVGTLQINGHYTTDSTDAVVQIDLAGPSSTEHDRLNISGTAALGGTLSVEFAESYLPAGSVTFTVLSAAGGISGTFADVTLPVLPTGSLVVTYTPTDVIVSYCAADFNGDGVLDSADYLDFLLAFAGGEATADFTGDGTLDSGDYLDFLLAFAAGC